MLIFTTVNSPLLALHHRKQLVTTRLHKGYSHSRAAAVRWIKEISEINKQTKQRRLRVSKAAVQQWRAQESDDSSAWGRGEREGAVFPLRRREENEENISPPQCDLPPASLYLRPLNEHAFIKDYLHKPMEGGGRRRRRRSRCHRRRRWRWRHQTHLFWKTSQAHLSLFTRRVSLWGILL